MKHSENQSIIKVTMDSIETSGISAELDNGSFDEIFEVKILYQRIINLMNRLELMLIFAGMDGSQYQQITRIIAKQS